MSKKKKIIIVSLIVVLALLIIAGIIFGMFFLNKQSNSSDWNSSKVNKLYSELKEKQSFSFTTILDEKNKTYYAKKDNTAYIDTIYKGEEFKFVIKDGNTYLLAEEDKKYYTYRNNETDLQKIVLQLEELQDKEHTNGKEQIENKSYNYEEYVGATGFLVKYISDSEEQEAKTRFYFKNDKLVFIKTIVGDYEENLKVEMSDDVDNILFEIPSDYEEA